MPPSPASRPRRHQLSPAPSDPAEDHAIRAEYWLIRLGADDVSDRERQDFTHWLTSDPAHAQAWDAAHSLMAALAEPARQFQDPIPAKARATWTRLAWTRRLVYGGVAACAALLIWMAPPPDWTAWRADHATGQGERRSLTLDDGSVVELDARTALDVDLNGTTRHVTLHQGRAFFQVRPDAARPFVVTTPHGRATVLGTRFLVAETGQAAQVAVEHGAVEVAAGTSPPQRLGPGRQSSLDGRAASPAAPFDPEADLAWRRGQMVFSQKPLGALAAALAPYWRGRLLVMGDELAARKVSGVFDLDRRDDSLKALQTLLGVKIIQAGPFLTILY